MVVEVESDSNRRAVAVATGPSFYCTFCNGCGNRNCFLGRPRAEGLLPLLALWFLITAPRGSSPGNKLEVPLRARTKPTLIPTALPREPGGGGGKKLQVPPTVGRTAGAAAAADGVSVLRHETNRITNPAVGSYTVAIGREGDSKGNSKGREDQEGTLSTSFSRRLFIRDKNPHR